MYRIFDRVLSSNIPIDVLPVASASRPDLVFRLDAPRDTAPEDFEHIHDWLLPDGSVSLRGYRKGPVYALQFPGLAWFTLRPGQGEITGHPAPGADENTLVHMLLDQVIPRLLGHGDHLVCHAAAVRLPNGRVAAFLGDTGAGKSTLTAAFQGRGAQVLSDDCLMLKVVGGRLLAMASYPSLRLLPDSLQQLLPADARTASMAKNHPKRRVVQADDAGHSEWLPVASLMALEAAEPDAPSVSVASLTGTRAFLSVVSSLFTLDVPSRQRAGHVFRHAGALLDSGIPLVSLRYPRRFEMIDEVCAAVEQYIVAQ